MSKRVMIWLMVIGIVVLSVAVLAACSSKSAATTTGNESAAGEECTEVPKPANAGPAGTAVSLTGDATAGAAVYTDKCAVCHGDQGKGGVENPGSEDGTVPELNPIDACLKSADAKTFATNIDLFLEYGNVPDGTNPAKQMPAFGQQGLLTQQQIADVTAYIISLNK